MNDGGKGSSPRPYSVSNEKFSKNWDTIFKKRERNEDGELLLGEPLKQDTEKVEED
jgi:hypothetical protein